MGAMVTGVDAHGVQVGDVRIAARTVLWGAGVAASPLVRSLGVPLDKAGRVKVTPSLEVPGREGVFVIGDVASILQDGKPVPGVAPAAMQMGKHTAQNIRRQLEGQPLMPFRYNDRGSFAVVGRGAAVGVTLHQRMHVKGWPAYLAWAGIHIFFLIGFRNRASVTLQWLYYFVTKRRWVRPITGWAQRRAAVVLGHRAFRSRGELLRSHLPRPCTSPASPPGRWLGVRELQPLHGLLRRDGGERQAVAIRQESTLLSLLTSHAAPARVELEELLNAPIPAPGHSGCGGAAACAPGAPCAVSA